MRMKLKSMLSFGHSLKIVLSCSPDITPCRLSSELVQSEVCGFLAIKTFCHKNSEIRHPSVNVLNSVLCFPVRTHFQINQMECLENVTDFFVFFYCLVVNKTPCLHIMKLIANYMEYGKEIVLFRVIYCFDKDYISSGILSFFSRLKILFKILSRQLKSVDVC